MKLPVYEELIIKNYKINSLVEKFQTIGVGYCPIYVDFSEIKKETALEKIAILLEALKKIEVSTIFPYPFYIISPYLDSNCGFPTVKSKEDLPDHFNKKTKRLKGKEEGLLNKTNFIARRLGNLNPGKEYKKIGPLMKEQKKLFTLSVELEYYEKLHAFLEATKGENYDEK